MCAYNRRTILYDSYLVRVYLFPFLGVCCSLERRISRVTLHEKLLYFIQCISWRAFVVFYFVFLFVPFLCFSSTCCTICVRVFGVFVCAFVRVLFVLGTLFGLRFGKFTQLQFDGEFRMSGSGCTTYLLEKSRVVGHEPGERAYHIFYQASPGWASRSSATVMLLKTEGYVLKNKQSDALIA